LAFIITLLYAVHLSYAIVLPVVVELNGTVDGVVVDVTVEVVGACVVIG